jgi:flagellar motor switch protein FliG
MSPSLRKAALLISALDEREADRLLDQMEAEQAARIRRAVVELTDISPEEQRQVLKEFFERQTGSAGKRSAHEDSDVILELNSDGEAPPGPHISAPQRSSTAPTPAAREPLFAFLERADPAAIASVLRRESPQTAAVVIAQLPPQHAAAILECLPPELATDALERMAFLDALPDEVLSDIADGMRRELASQPFSRLAGSAAVGKLTAVLDAMNSSQRGSMTRQLAHRNVALAQRAGLIAPPDARQVEPLEAIAPPRYRIESSKPAIGKSEKLAPTNENFSSMTFADIASLNDEALRSVLAHLDADVFLLALTGAPPRLVDRVLRRLPAASAATVRRKLENPGPVRLRDIELARAQVVQRAERVIAEGRRHSSVHMKAIA